jgi:hypothetical protein
LTPTRVVPAVHGVLDRVRQHQKKHQVEGSELAYLPLAGETKQYDQKDIDNDPAKDEFPPRYCERPHP